MTMLPAVAAGQGGLPVWTVIPFAAYLLAIAVLPLVAHHFWESNRNRAIVSIGFSIPVALYLIFAVEHGGHWLLESGEEYVSFVVLLGALFVITGGIYIRGSLAGTPLVNTGMLGIGAALASFIGTTGASMLLIRPLLRANEKRERKAHIVIFFIFIVANAGGMLTPLGDPPLFLGFLRGVPFAWTFRLVLPWLMVNGLLLVLFNIIDQAVLNREEKERPGSQLEDVQKVREPLRIEGGLNVLWLLGVVGVILGMGYGGSSITSNPVAQKGLQAAGMALMAVLSLLLTPKPTRTANRFTWGPIIEVAVIFIGIFVTMVPALKILESRGGDLGLTKPWQFFWATGILSSFLDNAPTYLTFTALSVPVVNAADPAAQLSASSLGGLAAHPQGSLLLTAISLGAVFMGANSYIGNGPNFMVKAIAEENKIKMPTFFGYVLVAAVTLLPIFVIVSLIFLR